MNNKQAFTLIELLVVVLIIGILAAVAVPQYQKAVLRARYSNLKDRTRALNEAQQRHYLATGTYAQEMAELDIAFNVLGETKNTNSFSLRFSSDERCDVAFEEGLSTTCWLKFNDTWILYSNLLSGEQKKCATYSTDRNDIYNNLCKRETGRTSPNGCTDNRCIYNY